MGGVDLAKDIILGSLKSGKSVVTANKAVIARYGEEIYKTAAKEGVYILSEAAVCGGIPIIEPLKRSLKSNSIKKMVGIINGTTNFILSKMANEKADYKETLKMAQSLGYAELDPTADVEGHDAADKISILSELAFGGKIKRDEIYKTASTEGIYILSEAAVCGGIPIIEPLKRSLKSNSIKKMVGIINGTTNFILSKMANEKADYKAVSYTHLTLPTKDGV